MRDFSYVICSAPDREKLVAELRFRDEQWAEINTEQGEPQIEIYATASDEPWRFSYAEMTTALSRAKSDLLEE